MQFIKFLLKRIITIIPVLFGVTFLVYVLMTVAPGNSERTALNKARTPEERQAVIERYGMDDPMIVRYARMMRSLFRDDSGRASRIITKMRVHLPHSLRLCLTALAASIVLALPLGIFAAIKQNTFFDGMSMLISLLGVSMPNFWLGIMIMLVFGLHLGWFPTSGSSEPIHIVMPAATLAFINMAAIARITRSSTLEVIRQDYIRTARAKGVPEHKIIWRHVLKNALIPTITVAGVQLGELLSSTIIIENIFAWPGVGRLLIQAINSRDMSMMIACVMIFAVCVSVINLVVDLLYAVIDPRISLN